MTKQQIFTWAGGALLALGLLFSGRPALAQEAVPKDQVSCEQLAVESAALGGEIEAMTRELTTAASGQLRAARAAQAAATATSLVSSIAGNIPVLGGLIGSVGSRIATAGVEEQQDRRMEVSERMMTRGNEIAVRLQEVEELRHARCGVVPDADVAEGADPAGE